MAGPARTPTAILKARGSWRAAARADVEAAVKAPAAPTWLTAEGKAEWKRQVKQLEALGVVAEIDRPMLAAYCDAWAEYVQARKVLKDEGLTLATDKGYIYAHPMVGIRNGAFDRMHKIAAQFGFTPAARARLKPPSTPEAPTDGKARFFQAG